MRRERFSIREVASVTGVSASTLRQWERRGLLRPARTAKGHRRYTEQDISRIRDIQRLRSVQRLNFAAIDATLGRKPAPCHSRQPSGQPEPDLGRQLQTLRLKRKWTVREVARRVGLSASFVSAIEQGVGQPSIAALKKLARCYGTTILALSSPPLLPPGKVIREGAYRVLPMLGPGIKVEQLAEGRLAMDCQRFTLSPGAGSQGQYAHEGEEFIHVISGAFEITLDGKERYRLRAGDSIYFKSTTLHAWVNPGPGETVLLWVNTPPTF